MVNDNEEKIRKEYEEKGYKVLRNGSPDFVAFKYNKETEEFSDVIFIEVKAGSDRLRYEQIVYKKILESLGLNYKLEYIQNNQPLAIQVKPTQGQTIQNNSWQIHTNQTQ